MLATIAEQWRITALVWDMATASEAIRAGALILKPAAKTANITRWTIVIEDTSL